MGKLILLYFGTIFLAYLSQRYYPVKADGLSEKRHFMRNKSDVFCVAIIVWMTCFSFLRTGYNDTLTYRFHFSTAESVADFLSQGGLLNITKNPLSILYRDFIRGLTDNYHIYFFFPAFLSSYAIVKLCKNASVHPAFSLLIFYSLGTYLMYVAALKQCIAVFILIIALKYATDKKYLKFYLLLFLAVLFHTHAFTFAIIPLLFEKPWGKVTWLFFGATVFAMLTFNQTLEIFMNYAQSAGALVDESELFDGHSINIIRVFVYWVPPLLAYIFRKRLFIDSTRTENLFVNMSIISAFILTIGLVQGANLFARMAGYFEVGTIIALPWMIYKIFEKKSANFVVGSASILYFLYFLYENAVHRGFGNDYDSISIWQFILEILKQ